MHAAELLPLGTETQSSPMVMLPSFRVWAVLGCRSPQLELGSAAFALASFTFRGWSRTAVADHCGGAALFTRVTSTVLDFSVLLRKEWLTKLHRAPPIGVAKAQFSNPLPKQHPWLKWVSYHHRQSTRLLCYCMQRLHDFPQVLQLTLGLGVPYLV